MNKSNVTQPFNPLDWSTPKNATSANNANNVNNATMALSSQDDFENLLQAIETSGTDLTADYTDWFRIGTAIASTYGERGRDFFHRISKFNNTYSIIICDKKYDDCLKDANPSVTLGSIYHLAKQHGIVVGTGGNVGNVGIGGINVAEKSPHSQVFVPDHISPFLESVLNADNDPAIQILLLFGTLISLSSVMPHVCGIYGGKRVYANLYGFVVAPPASSKGRLTDILQVVKPIDDEIRQLCQQAQEQYQMELAKYKAEKNADVPAPKQPPMRKLLLPANASSTAMYQALNDNNGSGLTFETEGDTVSQTLKSDYGNYSDGLRKAFHHEPISYMRRKDAEDAYIQHPRWSVLLSGTPAQVGCFVPNSENGLFSRFLFYVLPRTYEWKNVFEVEKPMDAYFHELGERYLQLYHALKQRNESLMFRFSKSQQTRFNAHFEQIQTEYASLYGDDLIASVRRLGVICFRLAMVLTITRFVDMPERVDPSMGLNNITCSDEDFDTAICLVDMFLQHTAHVYANLLTPIDSVTTIRALTEQQQQFYAALPNEFLSSDAVEPLAKKMHISSRTAHRWLGNFVSRYHILERVQLGKYKKL